MRAVIAVLLAAMIAALAGAWWLKREGEAPQAKLLAPISAIGRQTPIGIEVTASGPGLAQLSVRLVAGGTVHEIANETHPAVSWRGSLVQRRSLQLTPDLAGLGVPEGPAILEVWGSTHAWHILAPAPVPWLSVPLAVDLTPPQVTLLTTQHNLRLGSAALAVWRQSTDTIDSYIEVESYRFPAVSGYFADPSLALGFFAVPQDLDASAQAKLVASDSAGNTREISVPIHIKPRQFAQRSLAIDDAFLTRKVPEIEQANQLPPSSNLVEGYLYINRTVRQQNEARIREITAQSATTPLWRGAFQRQRNAAPLSSFADRRSYVYRGEVIDHQVHLGYDLASLRLAPVDAAQDGIVVFAGNLGIYGNTVIVDHGLGIFTLYGHLSSLAVQRGDQVRTGQLLGQTGETGLAGGDHLHFSVMLHGVHIDPVEWWDAQWLREHVASKLKLFPRATTETEEKNEQSEPRDAAAPG
jgi:murein DD-endopeptidase MepM/ murein hydrolase activator NlpD